MKAAVIGAGIGGIATAIRLQHAGFQVEVFEASEKAGGKLNQFQRDDFRFDMGPSLFTLPNLVEELYALKGLKPYDFFAYNKLDILCKYFYEDGTNLIAFANPDIFADETGKKTIDTKSKIIKFLKHCSDIYNITAETFLFNSLHDFRNYISWHTLKAIPKLYKINTLKKMHEFNKSYFSDRRLVQLFNRYATYNGSNPFRCPATLNVIAHLENNIGAYFPSKGMYSIAESLYQLSVDSGVIYHFNSKVNEIIINNRKATGILVNNEQKDFDVMVSDVDVMSLYNHLLPSIVIPKRIKTAEMSTSALTFYWGINNEFPELKLHNILFTQGQKEEFECLFQQKTIYFDPTIYIFISSKEVKSDAPAGNENWYVMVNAPENIGQKWGSMIQETRKNIIRKINRILKTDIQKHILFEEILDPDKIEKTTSSYHGSLYGPASNSIASAFYRHPNFTKQIKNLYFSGGSVHPGGGIPLCLASAKIIDKKIRKDYKIKK